MKRIVRLTESDLVKLVKRVISEQTSTPGVMKFSKLEQPRDYKLVERNTISGNKTQLFLQADETGEGTYLGDVKKEVISPEGKKQLVKTGSWELVSQGYKTTGKLGYLTLRIVLLDLNGQEMKGYTYNSAIPKLSDAFGFDNVSKAGITPQYLSSTKGVFMIENDMPYANKQSVVTMY